MSSLRQRLGLGLTVSLVVLFIAQWLLISVFIRGLVEGYVSARLEHDAEGLLAALRQAPTGDWAMEERALSPVYHRPLSGHYYELVLPAQRIRSRSLWDSELPPPKAPPAGAPAITQKLRGPQRQPLLAVSRSYEREGTPVVITVAEDVSPLAEPIHRFRLTYGLVTLAALVGLLWLQRRVVARGLAPLAHLRDQVVRLNTGEVERLESEAPDEVRPLAHEINHLLMVTGKRLQRSRDALGNLAHALKNPLSHLRNALEEPQLGEDERARLRRQLDDIGLMVNRELRRARLAGPGRPGRQFRPDRDLPPLVDAIERLYHDKPIAFILDLPERWTYPFDRDDMVELLGNLLDNAAKWCRGRVQVILADEPEALRLSVEDDGPGCPPKQCRQLLERGRRLDEAASGHGLGLSIVAAIVEDYGGELVLARSEELSGFRADLVLRLATEGDPRP